MGQSAAGTASAINLPSGIDASSVESKLFQSSCFVNGRVVAVPSYAEKILVVDPTSHEAFAIDLPSGISASKLDKSDKYRASCVVNGQVVALPFDAGKILVVDPTSCKSSAIDLPSSIDARGGSKFQSSCVVNGRVVAVPSYAEKILVVDPTSHEAFAIDLPSGISASTRDKYRASCVVNGQVVAVPFAAEKILVVDPMSREAFAIDLPSSIYVMGGSKFQSSCVVNGRVVAVPSYAEKILVVDPKSPEAFEIDLPCGISASTLDKYRASCVVVNGQVVAVPCFAEKVLVVDPMSREAFAIDLPSGIDANGKWKFQSSCVVNGQVVAVPCHAGRILVVDPTSHEAFAIDLPSGVSASTFDKYRASCVVNGQVVAVPFAAEKILVVDVTASSLPVSFDLNTSEVHNDPQFVELVAAMLSFWVYSEDPQPPEMANVTCEVHAVMQPGDLGRSLKIASVTAHLPLGKVFFIVFKGTSYMLDFLNWNLQHDHDITGETDFFVHSGAASNVRNARFLKSKVLEGCLIAAHQQGVKEVVFTGHSLGGMYAQTSLFLAWEEMRRAGDLSKILSSFDLKSFTFGAPMVFGGSTQKAREFKEFARVHAVNYIHAHDPCPRAWGALNLRSFIEQAAVAAKKGFQDSQGSLMGRVAGSVVEGMAAQFLQMPDFNLIEDLARKYEHFVPLKVLSTERQYFRWREFQLTPECLQDHSVAAYANKLFDAFDSSRPECHVSDQDS